MSQEKIFFSLNEESGDSLKDKVKIKVSSEIIQINYYQLLKWSMLVREMYPLNHIDRLSEDLILYQQKYNIKTENIKSFFQYISDEQVQVTLDQYFDHQKLSLIFGVPEFRQILNKYSEKYLNDVNYIIRLIKEHLISSDMGSLIGEISPDMEAILSNNIIQCFQCEEFGDLPISHVIRIIENSHQEIPNDILYDFIRESPDDRYILLSFLDLKQLSDQNFFELCDQLLNSQNPLCRDYIDHLGVEIQYLRELRSDKIKLQHMLKVKTKENDDNKQEKNKLNSIIQQLNSTQSQLQAENEQLKNDKIQLETELNQFKNNQQPDDDKVKIEKLDKENKQLKHDISELQKNNQSLFLQNKELINKNKILESANDKVIDDKLNLMKEIEKMKVELRMKANNESATQSTKKNNQNEIKTAKNKQQQQQISPLPVNKNKNNNKNNSNQTSVHNELVNQEVNKISKMNNNNNLPQRQKEEEQLQAHEEEEQLQKQEEEEQLQIQQQEEQHQTQQNEQKQSQQKQEQVMPKQGQQQVMHKQQQQVKAKQQQQQQVIHKQQQQQVIHKQQQQVIHKQQQQVKPKQKQSKNQKAQIVDDYFNYNNNYQDDDDYLYNDDDNKYYEYDKEIQTDDLNDNLIQQEVNTNNNSYRTLKVASKPLIVTQEPKNHGGNLNRLEKDPHDDSEAFNRLPIQFRKTHKDPIFSYKIRPKAQQLEEEEENNQIYESRPRNPKRLPKQYYNQSNKIPNYQNRKESVYGYEYDDPNLLKILLENDDDDDDYEAPSSLRSSNKEKSSKSILRPPPQPDPNDNKEDRLFSLNKKPWNRLTEEIKSIANSEWKNLEPLLSEEQQNLDDKKDSTTSKVTTNKNNTNEVTSTKTCPTDATSKSKSPQGSWTNINSDDKKKGTKPA